MQGNLRLDDFEKTTLEEIATLSGHSSVTVRDVLESTFLRQLEFIMSNKPIVVPFLGKLLVRYKGDSYVSGEKIAEIESFFSVSDLLKRLIGDIHDGESNIIGQLLQKQLKGALQEVLEGTEE
jgi:hypothetical protein